MEIKFIITVLVLGCFAGDLIRRGLVILRFDLPTAIRWYKKGKLVSLIPVTRYIILLLVFAALFIFVSWYIKSTFPDYIVPYLVGIAVMLLYGYSKSREINYYIANFVKYNLEYINDSELDDENKT